MSHILQIATTSSITDFGRSIFLPRHAAKSIAHNWSHRTTPVVLVSVK